MIHEIDNENIRHNIETIRSLKDIAKMLKSVKYFYLDILDNTCSTFWELLPEIEKYKEKGLFSDTEVTKNYYDFLLSSLIQYRIDFIKLVPQPFFENITRKQTDQYYTPIKFSIPIEKGKDINFFYQSNKDNDLMEYSIYLFNIIADLRKTFRSFLDSNNMKYPRLDLTEGITADLEKKLATKLKGKNRIERLGILDYLKQEFYKLDEYLQLDHSGILNNINSKIKEIEQCHTPESAKKEKETIVIEKSGEQELPYLYITPGRYNKEAFIFCEDLKEEKSINFSYSAENITNSFQLRPGEKLNLDAFKRQLSKHYNPKSKKRA